MRRASLSASVLCTLILWSRPVAGQETSSVDAAEGVAAEGAAEGASESEYRALIEAAVAEFAEHHHAEARALFRRAHAARPNARTLRGMGMSAFELRDYADSVRLLRQSLLDTRHALTDEQRGQVTELLSRAEAFVAEFTVDVPDEATISVDGVVTPLEPSGTLLLSLGSHALVVRLDGHVLGEARLDVEGGERGPLALELAGEVGGEGVPVEVVTVDPLETHPLETAPRSERDLGPPLVVLVLGGTVAIGGAVLLGLGVADYEHVTSAPRGTPWSTLEGAYGRAPVLEGVGAAALAGGLAAAVAGAIWIAVGGDEDAPVAVRVGPIGLSASGRF